MGIAVVGLLSAISTSIRNAARLANYDRIALVARAKMDALLLETRLPQFPVLEGAIDPALMAGLPAAWRAGGDHPYSVQRPRPAGRLLREATRANVDERPT